MKINYDYQPFGDGHSAQKILEVIDSWICMNEKMGQLNSVELMKL